MAFATLDPQEVIHFAIHCSATQAKSDIGVTEITRMHRQRGFLTIGYHYVIRRNGKVEKGRPDTAIGAHVEGWNSRTLGICLVGGITKDGKAEDNFTLDQYAALAQLLINLKRKFPKATPRGHRDFPNVRKDCPCYSVDTWVKETLPGVFNG